MTDSFAILLACGAFVLGVGVGLFLATTRTAPLPKGRPVSARRMSWLHVVDDEDVQTERQHPTVYPKGSRRL